MSLDRTKLLVSFAILGYLIGVGAYLALDWLIASSSIGIRPVPILDVILAPWFISGIAGSLLSVLILYVITRFSGAN